MVFDKNMLFVAVAAVLVGGVIGYFAYPAAPLNQNNETANITACDGEEFNVDMEKVNEVTDMMSDIYFIQTGTEHEVEYKSFDEGSGIITLNLMVDGNFPQQVYFTKDFKYMLQQPTELAVLMKQVADAKKQVEEQLKPVEIQKTDKPVVELFVMSYCPYGLQAEKALLPVIELLGDKADISVKFVNYAMHGEKEIQENLRQYCIQNEQNEKYFDYLKCFVDSGEYEQCLLDASIDADALDACMNQTDSQYGISGNYPAFPVYDQDNLKYGVRGSPTLIINGQEIKNIVRSPEAFKEAVCSAFTTQPEECKTSLSSDSMPPNFGYSGAGSNGGSCG